MTNPGDRIDFADVKRYQAALSGNAAYLAELDATSEKGS